MRILIDLDATIADIFTPWLSAYNRETGDDLTVERILTWDIADHAKNGKVVLDFLSRPGFFKDLNPLPGAVEAVRLLSDNKANEIFVVTAAYHPPNFTEKAEWVQRWLPFLTKRQFILAHEKHLIKADAFIDDSPRNARDYRKEHPHAFILSIRYPYNGSCEAYDVLAPDWQDPKGAWELLESLLNE